MCIAAAKAGQMLCLRQASMTSLVMVVVNGTTLLLGKGPSDTVTVWLGVAV